MGIGGPLIGADGSGKFGADRPGQCLAVGFPDRITRCPVEDHRGQGVQVLLGGLSEDVPDVLAKIESHVFGPFRGWSPGLGVPHLGINSEMTQPGGGLWWRWGG